MSASQFEGIPVRFCLPGSPAERAGVREGDRLLIVNGLRMGNIMDFVEARGRDSKRISLTLLRGNAIHDMEFAFDEPTSVSEPPLAPVGAA